LLNIQSAAKVVRSYTQKKLDTEESAIRSRFSERWQKLERAAELQARRALDASRKSSTSLHSKPTANRVKAAS
jgi:hypothetical protein